MTTLMFDNLPALAAIAVAGDAEMGSDNPLDQAEGMITQEATDSEPSQAVELEMDDKEKVSEVDERQDEAFYIVKIPRFNNDELHTELQLARLELDERTQTRQVLVFEIQEQRAAHKQYREKFLVAKDEERVARAAVSVKNHELDVLRYKLDRINSAGTVDQINAEIRKIEYTLQHETIPLSKEKDCIQRIKTLKQNRQELNARKGSGADIAMLLHQRDQIEQQFKALKMELDPLRMDVFQAECKARDARKKCNAGFQLLTDLEVKIRIASNERQEAYAYMQKIKHELTRRNHDFHMYKYDQRTAAEYANAGDKERLRLHCNKQVESVLELWNNDAEFRKEYVKANINSTIARFRTLDGRILGPYEKPALRPTYYKSSLNVLLPKNKKIEEERKGVNRANDDLTNKGDTNNLEDQRVEEKEAGDTKRMQIEEVEGNAGYRTSNESESRSQKKKSKNKKKKIDWENTSEGRATGDNGPYELENRVKALKESEELIQDQEVQSEHEVEEEMSEQEAEAKELQVAEVQQSDEVEGKAGYRTLNEPESRNQKKKSKKKNKKDGGNTSKGVATGGNAPSELENRFKALEEPEEPVQDQDEVEEQMLEQRAEAKELQETEVQQLEEALKIGEYELLKETKFTEVLSKKNKKRERLVHRSKEEDSQENGPTEPVSTVESLPEANLGDHKYLLEETELEEDQIQQQNGPNESEDTKRQQSEEAQAKVEDKAEKTETTSKKKSKKKKKKLVSTDTSNEGIKEGNVQPDVVISCDALQEPGLGENKDLLLDLEIKELGEPKVEQRDESVDSEDTKRQDCQEAQAKALYEEMKKVVLLKEEELMHEKYALEQQEKYMAKLKENAKEVEDSRIQPPVEDEKTEITEMMSSEKGGDAGESTSVVIVPPEVATGSEALEEPSNLQRNKKKKLRKKTKARSNTSSDGVDRGYANVVAQFLSSRIVRLMKQWVWFCVPAPSFRKYLLG